MTRYLPIEQTIFFGNAAADVVDDEVAFVAVIPVIRDYADVRHAFAVEVPRDDVAGLIVRTVVGNGNGLAVAAKKRLQIGNSSMVDVCVGRFQAPFLRICREIRRHVLVNFFLQVYAGSSKRANDNIRARSGVRRHVAAGIRQYTILLSVVCRYFGLIMSACDNAANRFGRNILDRRSLKGLSRSCRAKRVLKRCTATAGKANNKEAHYEGWSHIQAQLSYDH